MFFREAVTTPRRPRHYIYRAVYVAALMVLMGTAWLVLAGAQIVRNVGDMARFGSVLFQILAPLQLALVMFLAALGSASAVAQEKDRRTLILLLMTRMTNSELVLGKLLASMLDVLVMLAAALPVFMLITLFGGVSFEQVARVFAVTLAAALAAGSLGSTLALWRETTFQTLSTTALALVLWGGVGEAIYAGLLGGGLGGQTHETWAAILSPLRAIQVAAQPAIDAGAAHGVFDNATYLFIAGALGAAAALNLTAIVRLRAWNPSREAGDPRGGREEQGSIWSIDHDAARETERGRRPNTNRRGGLAEFDAAEAARAGHVDDRSRTGAASGKSRHVWDNPVLWREICTWAYGRKVLVIRLAYLLLFAMAAAGLHWSLAGGSPAERGGAAVIPAAAQPLAPFFVVSLVLVNALAVTSITNERDGRTLDLLLVTDVSPQEFLFGKLGGVLWVTKEMAALPMLLCAYLWRQGGVDLESLCFLLAGLAVMNLFAAMLGIHCGMTYANSRTAIGVSLGAVFFLFLGIVTCIVIMISFSGSFQHQLAPFLAFILGGGVGLYVALGSRNPSPAIGLASLLLPFATFHAITSFFLQHNLTMFLVTTAVYGFTTAAMMMPALGEFDIAMGRTRTAGDE